MKKLISLFVVALLSIPSIAQYPIKTIFKGDSVIILTIKQSDRINDMLEKSSKTSKDNSKKIQEQDYEIERLNLVLMEQNAYIDSLSNVLLEKWECGERLYDSIWTWALGPSIIYTLYPDDSTVYVMDLSHYYMTTNDFGVTLARMSDKEYLKYQTFISRYGLSEEAFWRFRNEMKVRNVRDTDMKQEKVWKSKMTIEKQRD